MRHSLYQNRMKAKWQKIRNWYFPRNRFLPMLMPKTEDGKTSGPDLSMLRSNDIQVKCNSSPIISKIWAQQTLLIFFRPERRKNILSSSSHAGPSEFWGPSSLFLGCQVRFRFHISHIVDFQVRRPCWQIGWPPFWCQCRFEHWSTHTHLNI